MTSPMLAAVYRGDRAEVDRLLADGVTLTLCEAAAVGDAARVRALARAEPAAIVSRLLAAGADVNARAGGGYTPLHIAAFAGDATLINTLLAHGADAEARADDGTTALAIAAEKGHTAAARRLRGEMP